MQTLKRCPARWIGSGLGLAALLLAGSIVAAPARTAELVQFQRTGRHMGVEFEVILYASSAEQANVALDQAFARIAQLDRTLSDYDPTSELSRLSQTSAAAPGVAGSPLPPTAEPVPVSPDLWKVLVASQALSERSEGAFDATIGPLTKLWRRARRQRELPAPERLAEARAAVGYAYLKLDPEKKSAQLLRGNMRLDLGGIAKGFAADEALAAITKLGIERALVRASGDIAVAKPPPGETGWRIGLAPLNPDDPPTRFVRLANKSISTSGDSRQHLVVDGRRYSHIIDPRTGMGVTGRSSVTVIAPRSMLADSLATAVSVLGAETGEKLVEQYPEAALFMVCEDDQGKQIVQTGNFSAFLEK